MNNSTTTTASIASAFGTTFIERYIQFGVYFTFSTFAGIANTIMAYGIAKRKDTRSRFNYIVMFILIARFSCCLQLAMLSVYRLFRVLGVIESPTRLACGFLAIWLLPATWDQMMVMILTADRAVALFAITYYRTLSWKSALQLCAITSLLLFIFKIAVIFGDPPLMSTVTCFNVYELVASRYGTMTQDLDFALVITLSVAFFILMVCLYVRLRRLRSMPNNDATMISIKRQMSVMPTLRNIIVVHCLWSFSTKALTFLGSMPFVGAQAARFALYAGICASFYIVAEVLVLWFSSADIRKATKAVFGKSQIQPGNDGLTQAQAPTRIIGVRSMVN